MGFRGDRELFQYSFVSIKSLNQMNVLRAQHKGFTLIEILIVIGIIAILAAVVIVAINPARQFAKANNGQRSSNINTILNAVHQFSVDKKGTLPPAVAALSVGVSAAICNTTGATCTATLVIDLGTDTNLDLANQTYIASMPIDPSCPASCSETDFNQGSSDISTGYRIYRSANNRITVYAPGAQLGEPMSVTR